MYGNARKKPFLVAFLQMCSADDGLWISDMSEQDKPTSQKATI